MSTNTRSIGEHIQRLYKDKRELSVDELLTSLRSEKFAVERYEVVAAFQAFEKEALGDFVVGRRGKPSRMRWKNLPRNLEFDAQVSENDSAIAQRPEMLDYPLVLRPGVTAKLSLPVDLSVEEAARVSDYVRGLPITPAT
jgi:hypothetical protein